MATAAAAIRSPSAFLALTDISRALVELGTMRFSPPTLASAPRGDGHSVLVLPGFAAGDGSTATLRRYIAQFGYTPHAWELGRNFGPRTIGDDGEHLLARVREIQESSGRKVSLIGWSLGGIMARLVAARAPDAVRQVITLGAPFAGSPKANNVWRAYEWLSGAKVDDAQTQGQLAEAGAPSPVPATAIYSRDDGFVAWQTCLDAEGAAEDNIEVHGSHCGLVVNPAVLSAVAERLARAE